MNTRTCDGPEAEPVSKIFQDVYTPAHYTQDDTIECIDAIKALTKHIDDGFEAYCLGCVVKYIWRFQDKNGLKDLLKASRYLTIAIDREIDLREEKPDVQDNPIYSVTTAEHANAIAEEERNSYKRAIHDGYTAGYDHGYEACKNEMKAKIKEEFADKVAFKHVV